MFSYDFQQKYKNTIDNLFAQLEMLDSSDSAAAEAVDKLSRYSTYLSFKLLSTDANGITEDLSRTINSKRLLIFDEAFNKMDPERIMESITMLREFGLQAIICSPTDKADMPYFPM